MGYLSNFIVYTLAMVGVIMLAIMVFKYTSNGAKSSSSRNLKVHDTLSLGPRKTLYVVSAGDEKFLIAGDVDRTTLISKLGSTNKTNNEPSIENINNTLDTFKETMEISQKRTSYIDRSSIGIYSTQKKPYDSVMKNLAERIKG